MQCIMCVHVAVMLPIYGYATPICHTTHRPVGRGGFERTPPPHFNFYTMPGYTCILPFVSGSQASENQCYPNKFDCFCTHVCSLDEKWSNQCHQSCSTAAAKAATMCTACLECTKEETTNNIYWYYIVIILLSTNQTIESSQTTTGTFWSTRA